MKVDQYIFLGWLGSDFFPSFFFFHFVIYGFFLPFLYTEMRIFCRDFSIVCPFILFIYGFKIVFPLE